MVLGNESAANGKIKNGLTECADMLNTSSEARQLREVEAGATTRTLVIVGLVQMVKGR